MRKIEDINFDNLNRKQKRRIIHATKRNMVKQIIPLYDKPSDERTGWENPKGYKTIWHQKRNNMPRLYSRMSNSKVTVKETVE
jgi:hypothetical protein